VDELVRLGAALREHRARLRLLVWQQAQHLGYHRRAVEKAEHGKPTKGYLLRWLRVYGEVEPELSAQVRAAVALLDHAERAARHGARQMTLAWWPAEWGKLGSDGPPALPDEDPMKRRDFLGLSAGVSLAGMLPADAADLRDYEYASAALRRAYQRTPASLLQPRVKAELDALDSELAIARGTSAVNRLLVPYAELHLLAAWMQRWDLADYQAAAGHTAVAAHAARQAGAEDVLAHAFALHALTCRAEGRVDEAVEAAEQARSLTSGHRPATKSYVYVALGDIHAKAGNEHQALADLEGANEALAKVGNNSAWPGAGVWGRERGVGYEAYALRRLGRVEDSRATLQAAFDEGVFEGASVKYKAVHQADQAETMAALGEVEEAVSWAMDAYDSATSMGYVGVIGQLRDLHEDLAPHAQVPAVRDLAERLYA
jgi:hypothetical protein